MSVSEKFINAVKLSRVPNYRLAMTVGVDPVLLSKFIHNAMNIKLGDTRVVAIGKLLGLKPDECFTEEQK